MQIRAAKQLEVYRKANQLSMEIFELSKLFPIEERYALVSQIRRSSHSISMNWRKTWAKRRYEARLIAKLTYCDGENSETDTSLGFTRDCGYLTELPHQHLTDLAAEIGRMLEAILRNPEPFLIQKSDT